MPCWFFSTCKWGLNSTKSAEYKRLDFCINNPKHQQLMPLKNSILKAIKRLVNVYNTSAEYVHLPFIAQANIQQLHATMCFTLKITPWIKVKSILLVHTQGNSHALKIVDKNNLKLLPQIHSHPLNWFLAVFRSYGKTFRRLVASYRKAVFPNKRDKSSF